jgi:HlyD family secretion protein
VSKNKTASIYFLAWLITSSIFLGCSRDRELGVKAAPPPDAARVVSCLGRLVAGEGALKVAGPPQAIVAELKVHRGSQVVRGDILAVLQDYPAARAALREAEQQVAVAESTLAQVKAPEKRAALAAQEAALARQEFTLQNATADYHRKQKLFENKLVPLIDVEAAETNFHTAQEDLRRQQELLAGLQQVRDVDVDLAAKKLAAAVASRDRAAVDVERSLVRAPMPGTVLEVFARAGEAVSAERGIVDLGDTANMFVEAEVYATDFPRVREGAKASITGEAFTGALAGTVAEILREAGTSTLFPTDPLASPDNRVVKVRIRLQRGQGVERLSGSQVAVRIEP